MARIKMLIRPVLPGLCHIIHIMEGVWAIA